MVFVLRRSETIFAPSTLNLLAPKLRTRAKSKCQRLLTVGLGQQGSVLQALEGRIDLECLCKVCCSLLSYVILLQAA